MTAPPAMRESWNAAWIRRCASPAWRASTTTEMLSSELPCAIATTLIRPAARAENTAAATPGVPCMPSPTTATVAMPGLTSMPSISPRRISPVNSRSRLSRASSANGSGTLKQIECSDDACEISDTEIWRVCSAWKVRAAMPGTPSIPLPVTVTSAWPPAAVRALTGKRRRGHSLRHFGAGRVGIGEWAHEHRNAAAGHGNERARVQHLGAVVRQFGRLARVELGNDPRVRHDARIGGEQPRHILPERYPGGAEPAREQRGGEVGAAAAQRRDLALGGGTDEPRHDRDDAARKQREQRPLDAPVGPGKVRGRLAERAVGVDEVEGVHILCLGAGRIQRGGHQARAQPLATRREIVGRPRGQLAQEPEPLGQRLQLREHVADVRQEVGSRPARWQQRPRHLGVP